MYYTHADVYAHVQTHIIDKYTCIQYNVDILHCSRGKDWASVYVVFGRIDVVPLGTCRSATSSWQQVSKFLLIAATSATLNACMSSPCANGSTCTPDPDSGSYTCHCPPGYTGPSCDTNIDECMEASCPENSTCEDGINAFRCVCDTGYEGPNCTKTASNDQG